MVLKEIFANEEDHILHHLTYFLWCYLKTKVNIDKPQNLKDLKKRIRLEIHDFSAKSNILEKMNAFHNFMAHVPTKTFSSNCL